MSGLGRSSNLSMPPSTEARLPSSLAPVRHVAAGAVLIIALCMFLSTLHSSDPDQVAWGGLVLLAVPVLSLAVGLVRVGGKNDWRRFWWALLVGVAVQAAVFFLLMFFGGQGPAAVVVAILGTALCFFIAGLVMLPVVFAAAVYTSGRRLDAGDAMLGVSGAWLLFIGTVIALLGQSLERWQLPGFGIGLLAIAIGLARAHSRRAWCRRATRGDVAGIRVRLPASLVELESLPPIYGTTHELFAVVERLVVVGTPYRSTLIGQPVASLRLPADTRPDELPAASRAAELLRPADVVWAPGKLLDPHRPEEWPSGLRQRF